MVDNSKYTPNPRKYYKSNFVELLELLTPGVYQQEDIDLSGTELNPLSEVINSHIDIANNISTVLPLSSVPGTQTENLGSLEGISQYFVKQNELTKITNQSFREDILLPLGKNYTNFEFKVDFYNYLSSTLLPKLIPPGVNTPGTIEDNVSELSAFTNNADASSIHNYLVDSLGWFYFLNTSALGGLDYSPSSYVLECLSDLFIGRELTTFDGVSGLQEYVWRNVEACSFGSYIPTPYLSGAADAILDSSDGSPATYTSGTQKLQNLQVLNEVIYSPLNIDSQDYTVKAAFDDFIDAQLTLVDRNSAGPHRKFLNALGFHFADISNQVEDLKYIYDIENAPPERLRYIADLIGFKLRGNASEKWRHQLRVATDIYKKIGTEGALRAALNALIVNSVLDLSGSIIPLWESYLPFLIWYSLGTESPLFKNLRTWTPEKASESGVFVYSTSSLEENLKLTTDTILLDLARQFPENFRSFGEEYPLPRFYKMNDDGTKGDVYSIVGDPKSLGWHAHVSGGPGYEAIRRQRYDYGERAQWDDAVGPGPFGVGVYMAGIEHPQDDSKVQYLLFEGDPDFVFNFRGRKNYPIPPFEEVKYFRDCVVTQPMVEVLVDKLKCFKVRPEFADQVGDYISEATVKADNNIEDLNEFLMFFSSVQNPPNYDDVMFSISDYERNLLSLWNGKSSHFFLDFDNTDFDFRSSNLENDSKYALYETARVTQEYSPAHSIPRVNLNASAFDFTEPSSTIFSYVGLDKEDTRAGYSSGTILGNVAVSGVEITSAKTPEGYSTFKRDQVDTITSQLSSTDVIVGPTRNSLRRRNLKNVLPKEGYYDRTGFNAPVQWAELINEESLPSSLGELTLGYIPSSNSFYPVEDYTNISGVWDFCENLQSNKTFFGIDTSNTFPYRGFAGGLGSDAKNEDISSATDRYVDRCQTPEVYLSMHSIFERKARDFAERQINNSPSSFSDDMYWKDQIQSFANSAIASGYVLNSFKDYEGFSPGTDFQKLYATYCKNFNRHPVGGDYPDRTGGYIFAHIFGKGLYNCDFEKLGANGASFLETSLLDDKPINNTNIFSDGGTGTFIARDPDQAVIPISGTYLDSVSSADYRNPTILSGIEFCDVSSGPSPNQFKIIRLDSSAKVPGKANYLINNTVVKCKTVGGLPRLRFDLSSYGDSVNTLVPEHQFELKVKALVADEEIGILGGGKMGIWIHTEPEQGLMWTWNREGKWIPTDVTDLSINQVKSKLSHIFDFTLRDRGNTVIEYCLNAQDTQSKKYPDVSLETIKEDYFDEFSVKFDTRNFTIHNNYEYLKIIDKNNEQFKKTDQIHKDRNYVIEVFFLENNNADKYMLLDSIELQDTTLRYQAGLSTGFGLETSGIPLTPFIEEYKYFMEKKEIAGLLKFYNGLIGQPAGMHTTVFATRDANISSDDLGVSGGSRNNYRQHPDWVPNTKVGSQYTEVEFDN